MCLPLEVENQNIFCCQVSNLGGKVEICFNCIYIIHGCCNLPQMQFIKDSVFVYLLVGVFVCLFVGCVCLSVGVFIFVHNRNKDLLCVSKT